jgi:hypothetical protein
VDPARFPAFPPNPVIHFLQADSNNGRYYVWRDTSRDPVILPANSSDVYHIQDISGYESLTPPSLSAFYRKHIAPDSLDLRLLGLANVKYVLTKSRVIHAAAARETFTADGVHIYENLMCKPRAYLAHESTVAAADEGVTATLLRQDFDGHAAVFAASDSPGAMAGGGNSLDSVQIERSENEMVAIRVSTSAPAILILSDSYYPGWKCAVNGVDSHIYRVNGTMRGVRVNAGVSNVEFRFEPMVLKVGAGISGIALLLALISVVILGVRDRNRARASGLAQEPLFPQS